MSFLPSNSTDLERTLEEAMDEKAIIRPAMLAIKGVKYARPLNPTVAPWLILEYGLGPISQFFDNPEDLIDEGRPWQKIRGTRAAIQTSFSWIGYDTIQVQDQVPNRRRWHLYQVNMGELPGLDEETRLANAEYLAGMSDSARNYFWRGFYGYDVRVHVWGKSSYGKSIWGDSSGVRLNGGMVKWSHGRQDTVPIAPTVDDYDELGIDYTTGQHIPWSTPLPWSAPGLTWRGISSAAKLKAWDLAVRDAYLGLYDVGGQPIGYIKNLVPAVSTPVSEDIDLAYDIRTGFEEAPGAVVKSISLIFGGQNKAGVQPYKRFVLPSQIEFPSGEIRVGSYAVDLTMQHTIREFFNVVIHIED